MTGVREPYSCGHCGAPVSPHVEQCDHCKVWLMPAAPNTVQRRSAPPAPVLPTCCDHQMQRLVNPNNFVTTSFQCRICGLRIGAAEWRDKAA